MKVEYKCCICGKSYDWYEGVHENLEENSGIFVPANSIVVKSFAPLPECEGEKLEFCADPSLGNKYTNEVIVNLCENCMHKLLQKISPSSGVRNYFDI